MRGSVLFTFQASMLPMIFYLNCSLTCNLKLEFWGGGKKNDLDTVMRYKYDHSFKII